MHTTADLLDEFKRAHGIESDYALARFLEVRKQVVSRYRTGVHTLGPELAFRIADDLRLDRGYVLACMAAERAQGDAERRAWRRLAERAAGIAAGVLVAFLVAPELVELPALSTVAASPLCIMTNGAGMLILALVALRILRRAP
jgi:hypothetical protein